MSVGERKSEGTLFCGKVRILPYRDSSDVSGIECGRTSDDLEAYA